GNHGRGTRGAYRPAPDRADHAARQTSAGQPVDQPAGQRKSDDHLENHRSASQQMHVIDVDRVPGAEDGDEDRQAHHDLNRGHDDYKKYRELSLDSQPLPGKCDERQVHRVQHQLDRHEHDERVPAQQHPGGAQDKQQSAERKVGLERDAHRRGAPTGEAAELRGGAATGWLAGRPMTTAAMMPTSRIPEATSKGNANVVKSARPTDSAVPNSAGAGAAAGVADRRVRSIRIKNAATSPIETGTCHRSRSGGIAPSCRCRIMITNRNSTTIAPA